MEGVVKFDWIGFVLLVTDVTVHCLDESHLPFLSRIAKFVEIKLQMVGIDSGFYSYVCDTNIRMTDH